MVSDWYKKIIGTTATFILSLTALKVLLLYDKIRTLLSNE